MAAKDRPRAPGKAVLLGLAAGITATLVAWGVLVLAAIDFGRDARGGATQSWYLLAGATVGAIACMFLAIIFAAQLQARLKGERADRRVPAATSTAEDSVRPGDVAEVPPGTAEDGVRPGDVAEDSTVTAEDGVRPGDVAEDSTVTAEDGVRAGDVVEVQPVPDTATPAADGEPAPYRSKHSRAAVGAVPEEAPDSPAAAYRGKRAAR